MVSALRARCSIWVDGQMDGWIDKTKEIITGVKFQNYDPMENLGQISMLNTSVHCYALRFGLAG